MADLIATTKSAYPGWFGHCLSVGISDLRCLYGDLATKEGASLAGRQADELTLADGVLSVEKEPSKKVAVSELMKANNLTVIDKTKDSKGSPSIQKYSMYSFSAHLVKVRVNPLTGVVRVQKRLASLIQVGLSDDRWRSWWHRYGADRRSAH